MDKILTSMDIKDPGLRSLPPGVERYLVKGGGLSVIVLDPNDKIEIKSALTNGQVSVEINEMMDASERGTFLLNLEEILKKEIDNGISIWHIPLGDKNSLRNLRGIEVTIKDDSNE